MLGSQRMTCPDESVGTPRATDVLDKLLTRCRISERAPGFIVEPASSSMKPSCSARGWWSSPSRDKGQELHGELQADCQNRATVVAFPRQSAAAGDISMHPWSQAPESLPGGRGCEESLSTTRRSKSDLSETGCALPRWQEADKANQADVQQSNPIHDFIATNNNHQVGTTYSQSPDRSPSVRSHPGSSVCSAPVSAACSVTSAQKRVGDCGMQVSHISRSGGAPRLRASQALYSELRSPLAKFALRCLASPEASMDEAANPKDSDEESCSPRTGPLPTPVTQPVERLDPRDVAGPDAIQDPLLTDSLPHPTREISPQVAKFWPPNPAPKMLKLYPKTTEETLARIKPMEHEIFSAKLGSGPNLPVEQAPCREVHAPGQLMADDIRKKYPNLFQSAQSVGSSGQALGNLELDMNDNNGTVDGFALHTGQGHDIGECGVSPTHSVLSFLEDSSRESDAPSIGRVMAFVDDGSRGIQDLPFLSQESRVQSLICNSLMTDGTAEEQAGASEPPAVSMAFAQPLSQAAEAVAEYYKTLDELSDLVSGLLVKLSPGPLRPLGKGALPDSKEVPAGTVSAMQRLPELCNSSLHASSADLMESISEEAVHSRSNISVTSNGNVSSVSSMAGTHGMFLRGHLDVHLPCDGRPPANLSDLEAVAHGPDHYRRGLHAGFTNDCILGPMLDVVESPVRHGNFVTTNSPSFKALYYSQATVMLPGLSTNDSSAQIHPPPDTRETMKWEPVPPNVEVLSPWACLDDKSWYSTSESRESPSCYSRSLSLQHSTAQPQQFSFSIVTSSAEKPPICKTLSVANQEP